MQQMNILSAVERQPWSSEPQQQKCSNTFHCLLSWAYLFILHLIPPHCLCGSYAAAPRHHPYLSLNLHSNIVIHTLLLQLELKRERPAWAHSEMQNINNSTIYHGAIRTLKSCILGTGTWFWYLVLRRISWVSTSEKFRNFGTLLLKILVRVNKCCIMSAVFQRKVLILKKHASSNNLLYGRYVSGHRENMQCNSNQKVGMPSLLTLLRQHQ